MRKLNIALLLLSIFILSFSCTSRKHLPDGPRKIEILFLGHDSKHHSSEQFMPLLAAGLAAEGINFTYTSNPEDLNAEKLAYYDGLMLYANHDSITSTQEKALLDFVESGRGFIPVHCASFCFRNSEKFINLVGGQFLKHDTGTVTAAIIKKDHPAIQSVEEFSSWDETYVHHKLTDDRTVLAERVEGDHREPWTWVRKQGKGRVYYTAYGHDERTWGNPGFHALLKQGIVWAVGDDVKAQWEKFRATLPSLVYKEDANIPNYERRDPVPKYQEPLSPEDSKKLIQVPSGFEVELFASEPDIINPIAMDWDEKGRLWVIETVDYPNSVRDDKGEGDDRIKICEDTDGDGKADKFTVFAAKLNIPTSIALVNGGAIVSQAPHFLFLKDTTGDDKADIREIIIDGWGTFDTHAGPSNLKYGIDNKIWGTVGYSGFKGTIAGERHDFFQGLYRFSPDVSDFEFMISTSNNTWGLGFTESNDVFGSTANNTHSVFMGISQQQAKDISGVVVAAEKIDGHYAMHPITDKVRQVDVFGGFTSAAGHNFYTARAYPKEYWDNIAFVSEPTGHLVHMAKIEPKGAGFVEKDAWNFFAGADEWVAPVEAKVGPDGVVWILDWYNFIIQHNPTPTPERGGYKADNGKGNAYENPLRDKSHGRIWRIVHRDVKPTKSIQLSLDNTDELVKALGNDNMFWRLTAQRLLVEGADEEAVSALVDVVKDKTADAEGNNFKVLHALWSLQGLKAIAPGNDAHNATVASLKHPVPAIRKAAIQILSTIDWNEQVINDNRILQDADPGVRLAAILSLTALPPSDSIGLTLYRISQEEAIAQDNWLAKATYVAAAKHRDGFVNAYLKDHPDFNAPKHMHQNMQPRESTALDDAAWKTMALPQAMEKGGLDIDGVVWFRLTFDAPASLVGRKSTLSLGLIDESDETWVNGVKVGSTEKNPYKPRLYEIPARTLKAGKNTIAVRVDDRDGRGGIWGRPETLYIESGTQKTSLVGDWKYDVEKEYRVTRANIFQEVGVADLFMKFYGAASPVSEDTEAPTTSADATVIRMGVIQNEMKFSLKTFTVTAGKTVEIVFENPDFMQHNLLVARPGSLKIVGAAADKLASDPRGAEMNYVPNIPEVLYATKLVNPQQTVKLTFVAPKEAGDYPYVCTFPGHWSIMNGVMKVVNK